MRLRRSIFLTILLTFDHVDRAQNLLLDGNQMEPGADDDDPVKTVVSTFFKSGES
mgnify:FL=1